MARTKNLKKRNVPTQRASPVAKSKRRRVPQAGPSRPPSPAPQPQNPRFERLNSLYFGAHRFLDWKMLAQYGLEEEIKELLSIGPWEQLFAIDTPAYKTITLEVLSTLDYRQRACIADHTLRFKAFNRNYKISIADFSHLMGLYTREEVISDEFRNLPVGLPRDVSAVRYWFELTDKTAPYQPSSSKASNIKSIHLKVIHHILASTIGARKSSTGVVNTLELEALYSMDKKYRIHVGFELARFIIRQATDVRTKAIYCGGYITRLLQGMNIFQQPANDPPLFIAPVSEGPLRHSQIPKVTVAPPEEPPSSLGPLASSRAYHHFGTSTSRASTSAKDRYITVAEFNKEKKKNKKFRSWIVGAFQKIAECFTPSPQLPHYETSPEPSTSEETETDDDPATEAGGQERTHAETSLNAGAGEEEEAGDAEGEDENEATDPEIAEMFEDEGEDENEATDPEIAEMFEDGGEEEDAAQLACSGNFEIDSGEMHASDTSSGEHIHVSELYLRDLQRKKETARKKAEKQAQTKAK